MDELKVDCMKVFLVEPDELVYFDLEEFMTGACLNKEEVIELRAYLDKCLARIEELEQLPEYDRQQAEAYSNPNPCPHGVAWYSECWECQQTENNDSD